MVIIHCETSVHWISRKQWTSPYRVKRNQHMRLGEEFLCVFTVDSMMFTEDDAL